MKEHWPGEAAADKLIVALRQGYAGLGVIIHEIGGERERVSSHLIPGRLQACVCVTVFHYKLLKLFIFLQCCFGNARPKPCGLTICGNLSNNYTNERQATSGIGAVHTIN